MEAWFCQIRSHIISSELFCCSASVPGIYQTECHTGADPGAFKGRGTNRLSSGGWREQVNSLVFFKQQIITLHIVMSHC